MDTEGLYFRATRDVLRTVGVHLTADQFKDISLCRGESTFVVAAEHGVGDDRISQLRAGVAPPVRPRALGATG